MGKIIRVIALLLAFFHLYTGAMGVLPHMQQRAIHVLFAFVLLFLLKPAGKDRRKVGQVPWWDVVISIAVVAACLNIFFNYESYLMRQGTPPPPTALVLGTVMLLIALEGGRRAAGVAIPILSLLMIAYAFLGKYIPGYWGFKGMPYDVFIASIYMYDFGIWGPMVSASASLVSMFLLFTSFLEATGGHKAFLKIANLLVGKYRGGPGMMAVVSSGLIGMITGSVTANVAAVGSFTIPLMKRIGYKPEFAGGLEALASCGGQIMPPVMGAGAFIMSEITGISYLKIATSAFVPACLYFFACLCAARFEALRVGLEGLDKAEIGTVKEVFSWATFGPILLPIGVLVYFILIGFSPYTSAFYALVLAFIIYIVRDFSPSGIKQRLGTVLPALEKGARTLVPIAALVVVAGVFVGLLFQTGLGAKVSGSIVEIGGTNYAASLFLAYIVIILIGTGVPIVATYILGASILAPVLTELGLPTLNAHFFIFFSAVLSDLTPPTCPGVYAASIIADAPWAKTSWVAMRIGFLAFALPFLFVGAPAFLLQGSLTEIVTAIITAVIGIVAITSGVIGSLHKQLPLVVRPFLIVGGILFWIPGTTPDLVGLVILSVAFVIIWRASRAKASKNINGREATRT